MKHHVVWYASLVKFFFSVSHQKPLLLALL